MADGVPSTSEGAPAVGHDGQSELVLEPPAKRARAEGAGADVAEPRDKVAEEEDDAADEGEAQGDGPRRAKRKLAIVIGYVGFHYRGLMINYEIEEEARVKSVEQVLRKALVRAGSVTETNAQRLEQKIGWSRSSRTDAGVSAARLIISARFLVRDDDFDEFDHCASFVDELNKELPDDVRCFSAVKVPRSFDAKRSCSWREYEYVLPARLATPPGQPGDVVSKEVLETVRASMKMFEGCHSFHNYCRLKASDLIWKSDKEAAVGDAADKPGQQDGKSNRGSKGDGKGKGKKGKKGKGKGKGKKGKDVKDGGQEESSDSEPEQEPVVEVTSPAAATALPQTVADSVEGPAPTPTIAPGDEASPPQNKGSHAPCWVELCHAPAEGEKMKERRREVLNRTNSTMWMCAVEPVLDGAFIRIRLRGQFFLYNQIRLMVGTAAARARGVLNEEIQRLALEVPVEMHMPLAPATGLFQRTSGFSMLDSRAGFAAMDREQADLCMLPETGFVLVDEKGAGAADAFTARIEREVADAWNRGTEEKEWAVKLDTVRLPGDSTLAALRDAAAALRAELEETQLKQAGCDKRHRDMGELGSNNGMAADVLPRRFATCLMVRLELIPGWRVNNIQRGLAQRLREFRAKPESRPESLPADPSNEDLLEYVASVGADELATEGCL